MQNCHTLMSIISIKHMSIRLEVNFTPKHQLICNYCHSNGLYLIYFCLQQAKQSFCSISLTFLSFLSLFTYFLISENQSAASNVLQLIKRKNRYDVPVPVCFKEFSATYYHICSNIYGIKSFILNNPILYVFLCVK